MKIVKVKNDLMFHQAMKLLKDGTNSKTAFLEGFQSRNSLRYEALWVKTRVINRIAGMLTVFQLP